MDSVKQGEGTMLGKPLEILLVEDNEAHAKIVERGLKNHRIANRLHHVPDGKAALDYVFRRGEFSDPEVSPRPHVILLDLRLPKVDGLEVLKTIKEDKEARRIPVIVLTTSEAEKDVMTAYDNHANAYLTKPVDFDKFAQQMNDLGFFWLCWNVNPDGAAQTQ